MRAATLALLVHRLAVSGWRDRRLSRRRRRLKPATIDAHIEHRLPSELDLARGGASGGRERACGRCAWDTEGREAVTLTICGRRPLLAALCRWCAAGAPTTASCSAAPTRDATPSASKSTARRRRPGCSATAPRRATTDGHAGVPGCAPITLALALAPFVYARPNTVGRFTDVPVFMWYEREPTDARHALPLLGHLHERGWRHADRSPDGDLGPHHRHRVRLQRRSGRARERSSPRTTRGRSTRCWRSGQAGGAPSAVVGRRPTTTWSATRATHGALCARAVSSRPDATSPAKR